MSAKKYLKLKINPEEIDLDTIKKTCEIQNSELFQEVNINDLNDNPEYWSRDKLIQQFNLLTVYPWFWKNALKSKANTATIEKALVFVRIDEYPGGINVPIEELKHFESNSKITKKLYLQNDFIPLTFLASDSEILTKGQIDAMIDENGGFLPPPKFDIDEDGDISIYLQLNLYTSWIECGKKMIDNDISGFYYEVPGIGRYSINEKSIFILEFEYPRTIFANKSSIANYITNPEDYYQMNAFVPWPPEKNYRYNVKDKHETIEGGGYPEVWYEQLATISRINEPNSWVGPYGDIEPDLGKFGAIEKRLVTDNINLMGSILGDWQTNFNGWYLKYDCFTYDAYWGNNDGSDYTLGNIAPSTDINEQFEFIDTGEMRRDKNIIKEYYKPPGKSRDELFPPGQSSYDPSSIDNLLYMSGFINGGKFLDSNAPNTPYVPPTVDNKNTFALNLTLGYSDCEVLYVNIRDNEGPQAQNQPHTGYGRVLFKAKSKDENMYLDKENTISSLTLTKEDTNTFEYGNVNEITFVQSSTRFKNENGETVNYGSNLVTLLYNAYFVHKQDQQNTHSTRIGMIIEAQTNTNTLRGCYGTFDSETPLDDNSIQQLDEELIQIIYQRGTQFYNALTLPEENKDPSVDNLIQYYDGISFGSITHPNQQFQHYHLESWDNIFPVLEKSTNKILYKVIKLGNIWIIGSGQKHYLSYPLINNGIIIIKNGGELVVRTNLGGNPSEYAYILNNGVIIRESGGILNLETPSEEGQKLLRHVSDVEKIVYKDSEIRDLKDTLHSVIIPSNTLKMTAKNNLIYKPDTSEEYSKDGILMISTNATDVIIPKWDKISKTLNFNLVAPFLSFNGILSELFFNIFIPDFLIFKWYELKRKNIEDFILQLSSTEEKLQIFAESVNEYENGKTVLKEIKILTDKITNESMSGIYLKLDIEGSGELIVTS